MGACQDCFDEIEKHRGERKFKPGDVLRAIVAPAQKTGQSKDDHQLQVMEARYQRTLVLAEWEKESASAHSKGPVQDEETVRRALREKEDMTPAGLAGPAFADLAYLGLSFDRPDVDIKESVKSHTERLAKDGQSLWGFVELSVKHLRSLQQVWERLNKTSRQVGVYDTAEKKNPAHAEAYIISHVSNSVPFSDLKYELAKHYADKIVPLA